MTRKGGGNGEKRGGDGEKGGRGWQGKGREWQGKGREWQGKGREWLKTGVGVTVGGEGSGGAVHVGISLFGPGVWPWPEQGAGSAASAGMTVVGRAGDGMPCERALVGHSSPRCCERGWVWAPNQVWGDGSWERRVEGARRDTRGKRGYDGRGTGVTEEGGRSWVPVAARYPRQARV